MELAFENYEKISDKGLEELKDDVGNPEIEHKKMTIYT